MTTEQQRQEALGRGVRAEIVTLVWMTVEAVVAIGSGIAARSLLLTAFGLDSVIELISGGVLLWRFHAERAGHAADRVERSAAIISAILLALLCLYVLASSIAGLVEHRVPDASLPGIVLSAIAAVAMPLLASWKRRINAVLNSDALRADIAESIACGAMSLVVLMGLGVNMTLRWWWIDSAGSLVLLVWLAGETKEAFEAARGDEDDE